MRIFLAAFLFVAAACGGSSTPAPQDPCADPCKGKEPPVDEPVGDETMMSPEECESAGGQVVGDIGDGNVACPEGTESSGNVSGGVEQQLCCQAAMESTEE